MSQGSLGYSRADDEVPAHATRLRRAAHRRGRCRGRRGRAGAHRGVPPPARPGHVGGRADAVGRRPPRGAMVRAFDEIPRDTGRVIFFPRAAGGGGAQRRGHDRRALRHRDRRPRPAVGDLDAVARAARSTRAARARRERRAERRRRVRPRPRAPRRAARPRAAQVVRERGGVGDVPRPRVPARLGRPVRPRRAERAARRRLRLPDLPAQADRRLPAADRPAAQRVLRRVPGRDAPVRLAAAARLRRRAGQVDGAEGRRAPDHRRGEPAPARPPARPAPDRARPLAPRPLGARAPRPRHARRQRRQRQAEPADG